jgi:uncharacterized membrane protein YadS
MFRTIGDGTALLSVSDWQWLISHVTELGKSLILAAMAGIGLNTRVAAMRQVGARHFVVGLIASLLLALISLPLIFLLQIS